jgi:hypothetical protein
VVWDVERKEEEMASNLARVIPLRPERDRAREVIAVVLADGTVRPLDEPDDAGEREWTSGQLTGDDWVLWWQRRQFDTR